MDFSAPHIGFVIASYALSGIFICALTVWVIVRDRSLRAQAERLDRQRRRGDA